jgi:hypothetical protein
MIAFGILVTEPGPPAMRPIRRSMSTSDSTAAESEGKGEAEGGIVMQPGQDLPLSVFKYRVMKGSEIIGQFSNVKTAADTARAHRDAIVLDMSLKPPMVVYRNGTVLEVPESQGHR